MSSLDLEERKSDVPGSENMIQYYFNRMNELGKDPMQGIKKTPILYRTVNEGHRTYLKEKNAIKDNNGKTPIVTGEEARKGVENEFYRGELGR